MREEAFYMKRAIDGDDLKVALDHATDMLRELKSSTLNPKTYYELYMKVGDSWKNEAIPPRFY